MSGAYAAAARGSEAIFLNPANLGLDSPMLYSMNILGMSVDFANNALSHVIYQRYVGTHLDEDEITEILNAIPKEGFDLSSNAKVQGICLGFGPFAFGVRGFSSYSSSFAREIFELMLRGNEINRVYEFNPVRGDGMTAVAIGLGYGTGISFDARVLKRLSFGVTGRYLYGLSYAHITESTFHTSTTYSAINGNGHLGMNYAEGGRGWGITAGISAQLENKWTFSVVFHNPGSRMTWDRHTRRTTFDFHINEHNFEDLLRRNASIDSIFITNQQDQPLESFNTQLPQLLDLGLMVPLNDKILLLTELELGLKDTALSSRNPRIMAGGEIKLTDNLRVRTGMSQGGSNETYFSGGLGVNINRFCWDVAFRTYGGITSETSTGFGLATSLAVRI